MLFARLREMSASSPKTLSRLPRSHLLEVRKSSHKAGKADLSALFMAMWRHASTEPSSLVCVEGVLVRNHDIANSQNVCCN